MTVSLGIISFSCWHYCLLFLQYFVTHDFAFILYPEAVRYSAEFICVATLGRGWNVHLFSIRDYFHGKLGGLNGLPGGVPSWLVWVVRGSRIPGGLSFPLNELLHTLVLSILLGWIHLLVSSVGSCILWARDYSGVWGILRSLKSSQRIGNDRNYDTSWWCYNEGRCRGLWALGKAESVRRIQYVWVSSPFLGLSTF